MPLKAYRSSKFTKHLVNFDTLMFAPNALNRLARLYNLQSSYCDGLGQPRQASTDAILQVLQALGAPLRRLDEAEDAWRQRRQAVWQRVIEPVNVIWQNQPGYNQDSRSHAAGGSPHQLSNCF